MRVDNVNQSKKIGYIKFNSDTEMDLIAESFDKLIAKQQELVDMEGAHHKKDADDVEKLERFKKSKDSVIEMPRQNRIRLKAIRDQVKEKNDLNNKNNIMENKEAVDVEDTAEFKQMARVISESEAGSGIGEGTEVTHRNLHVLANALNNHIWEMEKSGLYRRTNRNKTKYAKLQQLLWETQEQKAKFERVRQKPRGWGRLRK